MHQSFFMASLLQTLDGMGQALQHSLVFNVEGLQPLAHQPSAPQDLLLAESVPCRFIPLPQHQTRHPGQGDGAGAREKQQSSDGGKDKKDRCWGSE